MDESVDIESRCRCPEGRTREGRDLLLGSGADTKTPLGFEEDDLAEDAWLLGLLGRRAGWTREVRVSRREDGLAAARGAMVGMALGLASWSLIVATVHLLRSVA
ncbi:MAG: hypothetical protein ACX98W_16795 [bacterium]